MGYEKKKIRVVIAALAVVVAAVVFVKTASTALFYAPEDGGNIAVPASFSPSGSTRDALAAKSASSASASDAPARLVIPALGVSAAVQNVGVNAEGNMGVPNNFTDVGWYRYGTVPGEIGSAVMAGHVDNGLALAGVFKHLDALKAGDDIFVVTNSAEKLHFVVSDVETYPYTAVPTDVIFNAKDAAHLNLVTCDGAWVQGGRTYDHRLVVFSKMVE